MAFPDPDTFTALRLEERAMVVLKVGITDDPQSYNGRDNIVGLEKQRYWDRVVYSGQTTPTVSPTTYQQAFNEAFDWLAVNGLTTRDPGQSDNFIVLTSKGRAARAASDPLRDLEARKLLTFPLYDRLSAARTAFESGDFEGAVFKAMRAVENAVKDASGLTERMQPKALMTRAFKAGEGPLTDPAQETAEQEGVMYLFMGAIGALRNPVGHREDLHEDPAEAAKIVIFADLLMDIVDRAISRGSAS